MDMCFKVGEAGCACSRVSLLLQVADQLCAKYSKEYGKLCRTNQIGTVNDRVMNWKNRWSWQSSHTCQDLLPLGPVASGWCLQPLWSMAGAVQPGPTYIGEWC